MSAEESPRAVVTSLREALPYLRLFQGRCFVVKTGGEIFENAEQVQCLLEQIGVLHRVGIRVVLVHGGGPQVSAFCESRGHEPEIVGGRRVTDPESLDAALMVMKGRLCSRLVAVARGLGIRAVGLSGVDGELVQATKRPPCEIEGRTVDFGEVGDIESIDVSLLDHLLDDGYLPIVSPLSADENGRILNVNADRIAAAFATAMQAEKLIMVTTVAGILERPDDPSSLVSYTDVDGLGRLVESGAIRDGMLPKVDAVKRALEGGVSRVHLISFRNPDSLLGEIFTNEGSGTLVVSAIGAES